MNDFTKDELICIREHLIVPNTLEEKYLLHGVYLKLNDLIKNHYEIPAPAVDKYICAKCNEEWYRCECNSYNKKF